MAGGMFDYDEAMTDLVMEFCRERLSLQSGPARLRRHHPGPARPSSKG